MAAHKKRLLIPQPLGRWRVIVATSISLLTGLVTFYSFSQNPLSYQLTTAPEVLTNSTLAKLAVTALGRLQPEGEVTNLSAPNSINGVRVEKTLVKEGQEVKAGQVLAYLENYHRSTTALEQRLDQLEIAKAKLAQVKSGAKPGDIAAQKAAIARLQSQLKGEVAAQQATINRIQAELENAQTENNRYQQLYKQGAVSASVADSKALQLKTAQQQLQEAKASLNRTQNTLQNQLQEAQAKLNSISQVRTVDVELAETEVKSALTAIKQAQADKELTYLKSPINGQILKIHAKTGEVINTNGFAEIGKISRMYVVAEVYQTDIQKVNVGQKATITSNAFPGKIEGTVTKIGWQVDRQSIFSLNPAADTDRRIVEVKISINDHADSQRVARLTNLQVDVAIHI
ncbi:ABC exporter membrane fusion protein [Umezakia ovalisporum]|jgi:HlyD family secretion protein|uniref:ABC exporter membrane fusion protein n=2 Tax=Umezakia ovalisporum TaxID=75695 RepID=A0AA43GXF4_9CYAN|nr:ABC exporter membrane fusion protein [Umezakia ovalisporum]MBI1242418.1 HlyD family efflux transporter periplasmic adaptor subunit [Nostoc sp. RI_552]MDH6056840.1 ABC exporter membrane fusion protein [Umezakia ovalisporum FSS-43]MDH6063080.1 ABC exporter membrane fusion protein [Umezakia ovalisporum FSS-62]MDH6068691.1 ABC exporter membrane fusion protein [Umezakia ovalisporum APH033B]MDH6071800.1 ABC exporter membrane fusion protein [Umezakia ovalisporum CobakiLakeA]